MSGLAFVLVVTDGAVMRTLYPAGLGAARAAQVERIVREHFAEDGGPVAPAPVPPPAPPEPPGAALMTQREIASAQGFTGDMCPSCGSMQMVRTGTCVTCQACSHNAGCG